MTTETLNHNLHQVAKKTSINKNPKITFFTRKIKISVLSISYCESSLDCIIDN